MLRLYFSTYNHTVSVMIQSAKKEEDIQESMLAVHQDSKYHQLIIPSQDIANDDLNILNSANIDRIRKQTANYNCDFGCHFDNKTQEEIEKAKKAQTKLLLASAFCVVFMAAELAGGYIAHSIALMSDALHLLSDCGGLMISVVALVRSLYPEHRLIAH